MNTLVLLLALAAAPHIPPSLDLSGRSVSPVASLIAWDKGGSADWGAGIPSPTIDCAAGAAGLSCAGATASYQGAGEAVVASPFWYRGDTAVRSAVRASSSDFYRLGDTPRSGSFSEVFAFKPVLTATYIYLVSKGGDAGFIARINSAGTVQVYINGATALTCGAVTSGNWYVLAYAYERLTEGTSRIRCSLNGSAGTEVTNAGLLVASGTDLLLTDREDAPPTGHPFSGDLRRYSRIDGFAATAAQLAQLVATQWGLAHDKPAGTVATHTRTDSTPCGPFSDSELYWLGPGAPCIHAPTYQGWASGNGHRATSVANDPQPPGAGSVSGGVEVYGIGLNALPYSTVTTGWSVDGAGVTFTGPSDLCPLDPLGTRMFLAAGMDATNKAVFYAGTSGTPWTAAAWMARPTAASDCTTTLLTLSNQAQLTVSLTGTPVRYASTWTGAANSGGIAVKRLAGNTCTDVCISQWQATPTAYPVPYRATTGTAYTGTASTATTLTVPTPAQVTDARGAVATCFQTAAGSANKRIAAWSATASPLYFGDVNQLYMYDSANFTGPVAYSAGSAICARAEWSGTTARVTNVTSGASAAGTFDGSMVGAGAFGIGCNGATGANQIDGLVSRVALCNRGGSACR